MIEYSNQASSTPTAPTRKPLTTIRASSGWPSLQLRQIWIFRDLLLTLANRDIKLRYKQTVLGVAWVILQPLITAGALSFIFNIVAGLKTDDTPPLVFAFIGSWAYTVFRDTLNKTTGCLVGNAHLISKVYFPRLVLPLSTTISVLLDFAVSSLLVIVLLVAYQIVPTIALLTLPIWLGLMLLMAMGFGLIAASLTVPYRDVQIGRAHV